VEWTDKLQQKGLTAASAGGPSDWKSAVRKHREAPNISPDPQETKRILLKSKKFVNACLRVTIFVTKEGM
jgi:hypothetical protein